MAGTDFFLLGSFQLRRIALCLYDILQSFSKFYGAFGKGSLEELETFEEEAQMGRCDLSKYYGILGKASAERLAELEGSNDSADLELLPIEENIEIGSRLERPKA